MLKGRMYSLKALSHAPGCGTYGLGAAEGTEEVMVQPIVRLVSSKKPSGMQASLSPAAMNGPGQGRFITGFAGACCTFDGADATGACALGETGRAAAARACGFFGVSGFVGACAFA